MPEMWHVRFDHTSYVQKWCVLREDEQIAMFDRQTDAWQHAMIQARKWRGAAALHKKNDGGIRDLRVYNKRFWDNPTAIDREYERETSRHHNRS